MDNFILQITQLLKAGLKELVDMAWTIFKDIKLYNKDQ